MKKVGAISIAAFYLLLTTGMYVCILHCVGDYFLNTHSNEVSHSSTSDKHKAESNEHIAKSDDQSDKSCGDDENCSCCNDHGQYAVKENIPSTGISYCVIIAILNNVDSINSLIKTPEGNSIIWPKGHAPPHSEKEPLYISYRSLLI